MDSYNSVRVCFSPGDQFTLKNLSRDSYSGWLSLHNPSKDTTGFKVHGVFTSF